MKFHTIKLNHTTTGHQETISQIKLSLFLQKAYLGDWYESVRQDENWMRLRKKVDTEQFDIYIKWINLQFSRLLYDKTGPSLDESKCLYTWLVVGDLQKDLEDGLRLIYLIEIIYDTSLSKEFGTKNLGCLNLHKIKNHDTCLGFLKNEIKLKCVGINAVDLAKGNLKMLTGLLFLLKHDFESRIFNDTKFLQVSQLNLNYIRSSFEDLSERKKLVSQSCSDIFKKPGTKLNMSSMTLDRVCAMKLSSKSYSDYSSIDKRKEGDYHQKSFDYVTANSIVKSPNLQVPKFTNSPRENKSSESSYLPAENNQIPKTKQNNLKSECLKEIINKLDSERLAPDLDETKCLLAQYLSLEKDLNKKIYDTMDEILSNNSSLNIKLKQLESLKNPELIPNESDPVEQEPSEYTENKEPVRGMVKNDFDQMPHQYNHFTELIDNENYLVKNDIINDSLVKDYNYLSSKDEETFSWNSNEFSPLKNGSKPDMGSKCSSFNEEGMYSKSCDKIELVQLSQEEADKESPKTSNVDIDSAYSEHVVVDSLDGIAQLDKSFDSDYDSVMVNSKTEIEVSIDFTNTECLESGQHSDEDASVRTEGLITNSCFDSSLKGMESDAEDRSLNEKDENILESMIDNENYLIEADVINDSLVNDYNYSDQVEEAKFIDLQVVNSIVNEKINEEKISKKSKKKAKKVKTSEEVHKDITIEDQKIDEPSRVDELDIVKETSSILGINDETTDEFVNDTKVENLEVTIEESKTDFEMKSQPVDDIEAVVRADNDHEMKDVNTDEPTHVDMVEAFKETNSKFATNSETTDEPTIVNDGTIKNEDEIVQETLKDIEISDQEIHKIIPVCDKQVEHLLEVLEEAKPNYEINDQVINEPSHVDVVEIKEEVNTDLGVNDKNTDEPSPNDIIETVEEAKPNIEVIDQEIKEPSKIEINEELNTNIEVNDKTTDEPTIVDNEINENLIEIVQEVKTEFNLKYNALDEPTPIHIIELVDEAKPNLEIICQVTDEPSIINVNEIAEEVNTEFQVNYKTTEEPTTVNDKVAENEEEIVAYTEAYLEIKKQVINKPIPFNNILVENEQEEIEEVKSKIEINDETTNEPVDEINIVDHVRHELETNDVVTDEPLPNNVIETVEEVRPILEINELSQIDVVELNEEINTNLEVNDKTTDEPTIVDNEINENLIEIVQEVKTEFNLKYNALDEPTPIHIIEIVDEVSPEPEKKEQSTGESSQADEVVIIEEVNTDFQVNDKTTEEPTTVNDKGVGNSLEIPTDITIKDQTIDEPSRDDEVEIVDDTKSELTNNNEIIDEVALVDLGKIPGSAEIENEFQPISSPISVKEELTCNPIELKRRNKKKRKALPSYYPLESENYDVVSSEIMKVVEPKGQVSDVNKPSIFYVDRTYELPIADENTINVIESLTDKPSDTSQISNDLSTDLQSKIESNEVLKLCKKKKISKRASKKHHKFKTQNSEKPENPETNSVEEKQFSKDLITTGTQLLPEDLMPTNVPLELKKIELATNEFHLDDNKECESESKTPEDSIKLKDDLTFVDIQTSKVPIRGIISNNRSVSREKTIPAKDTKTNKPAESKSRNKKHVQFSLDKTNRKTDLDMAKQNRHLNMLIMGASVLFFLTIGVFIAIMQKR